MKETKRDLTKDVIAANERYFDAVAGTYDDDPAQRYGSYHPNSRTRYRAFIRKNLATITRGVTVNLGCGTGNMMDVEAECGLQSIGVDISWAMLERARRVSPRVVRGEVHQLPLPDKSVSLASCFLLLHHVYDHKLFFREVSRVLMPGGILYSDYDPNFYPSAMSKDHWFLGAVWNVRRRISYRVMGVGTEIDLETARLADYYSETVPGLQGEQLSDALVGAGFGDIHTIPHSDGTSLTEPARGRLVHKTFEAVLWLCGEKDYRKRAKILAVVAQKPGPPPQMVL